MVPEHRADEAVHGPQRVAPHPRPRPRRRPRRPAHPRRPAALGQVGAGVVWLLLVSVSVLALLAAAAAVPMLAVSMSVLVMCCGLSWLRLRPAAVVAVVAIISVEGPLLSGRWGGGALGTEVGAWGGVDLRFSSRKGQGPASASEHTYSYFAALQAAGGRGTCPYTCSVYKGGGGILLEGAYVLCCLGVGHQPGLDWTGLDWSGLIVHDDVGEEAS